MPRVSSPAATVIGANIREIREARTWTQDQLAVATGIDSSNVRAYEAGRSLVSIHSLIRISEALETDPGALLKDVTADLFVIKAHDARRRDTAHRAGSAGSAA